MQTFYAKHRDEWRAWLEKNHDRCDEIWLIYSKKASDRPRVAYEDAVEEALGFGWIDGKIKKIDEARFAQRFTPRRPKSSWNQSNIQRAQRLIEDGKMMPAGLAAFHSGSRRETPKLPAKLPEELEVKFRKQVAAWKNFTEFPPYYRRMTSGWVASAKREETRLSRLEKLIEFSARNERIKFM